MSREWVRRVRVSREWIRREWVCREWASREWVSRERVCEQRVSEWAVSEWVRKEGVSREWLSGKWVSSEWSPSGWAPSVCTVISECEEQWMNSKYLSVWMWRQESEQLVCEQWAVTSRECEKQGMKQQVFKFEGKWVSSKWVYCTVISGCYPHDICKKNNSVFVYQLSSR